MSDNPVQQEEKVRPGITISFLEAGSALFDIQIVNPIMPTQILLVAEWLRIMGESQLMQQQMEQIQRESERRIVTPRGKIVR